MDDWRRARRASTVEAMNAAVLVTGAEPETQWFLERELPRDGFQIARLGGPLDLVLAGDLEVAGRWVERAPVIVLGPEASAAVDALRRGCDDFLVRPFEYQELVERIRAVLRRTRPRDPEVIDVPPVWINVQTRAARIGDRPLRLAQKEYDLLLTLAREPERVFTKAELLRDIWGYRVPGRTRTLDSHASRLRRKLREADASCELVDNVWGVGYRLRGTLVETT
jgi:DNA-binding response OmpR family regulator